MHAATRNIELETFPDPPEAAAAHPPLTPVHAIKPGQFFVRLDSPSEVLVLLSTPGGECGDSRHTWAVVHSVNHDSEGYVPGQLLRINRTTHVRVVHEARAPVFALEP